MLTRGGICVPPTVTYLPYRVSRSTLTAVGRSRLLDRWPGTHSRILSGITRTAQTVLGVYLKRTCTRDTSASSALGVLNDNALYKSTHSLTQTARIVQQHHDHCHHPHTYNTESPCSHTSLLSTTFTNVDCVCVSSPSCWERPSLLFWVRARPEGTRPKMSTAR